MAANSPVGLLISSWSGQLLCVCTRDFFDTPQREKERERSVRACVRVSRIRRKRKEKKPPFFMGRRRNELNPEKFRAKKRGKASEFSGAEAAAAAAAA